MPRAPDSKHSNTLTELDSLQSRVAQEPETRTAGTVFPGTDIGTGTVGTVLQEPKAGTGTVPSPLTVLKRTENSFPVGAKNRNHSMREPLHARTATEPNQGQPDKDT